MYTKIFRCEHSSDSILRSSLRLDANSGCIFPLEKKQVYREGCICMDMHKQYHIQITHY